MFVVNFCEEQTLSDVFITYWTTFSESVQMRRSPFNWPEYQTATDTNLVLDLEISTNTGYRKKFCDFFDSIEPFVPNR